MYLVQYVSNGKVTGEYVYVCVVYIDLMSQMTDHTFQASFPFPLSSPHHCRCGGGNTQPV